ncbi:MAG TPA: FAD-dependent oxidoreductase [Clostridia bacterium]|nr:FAD-dependent oxidoreductase [Clostridia bacterium]
MASGFHYDVIIVGAGPAGIFTAFELYHQCPQAKVLLLDKGKDIYHRYCPISDGKIDKCPSTKTNYAGCLPTCSITGGWGGAGAYSDGKFNLTTEFGGWMQDYLSKSEVLALIKYVDEINLRFGAPPETFGNEDSNIKEIKRLAAAAGLKLLPAVVRHLGTEKNREILTRQYEYLKDKIEIRHQTMVTNLLVSKDSNSASAKIVGVRLANGDEITAPYVVVVPGRDGSDWFISELKQHNLHLHNNQVDIGVRVEVSSVVLEHITDVLYEGKLIYHTKQFGDQVRTFCTNPNGHVVIENHSGIMTVNGHSYLDKRLGSENTNFALLVSHHFTEPFNQPIEYAKSVARLANMLSNGSVIVQRFGDLIKGRRSTVSRIARGFVEPTLKEAVPGDLSLVLPHRTIQNLIEMIYALDQIAPGMASEHTLFYGVETKFYSARPKLTKSFETEISGLFTGGDGGGLTRGLAQAAASGVVIGREISKRLNNR